MLRIVALAGGLAAVALPVKADMAGHWLHVGDPSGHVVSHVEELVILEEDSGEGLAFEIRVHRLEGQMRPECLEGPASPSDCSAMVVSDRGRLVVDEAAQTLTVTGAEVLAEPFAHPADALGWSVIGLARGGVWDMALSGGVLDLSRSIAPQDLPAGWPGPPRDTALDLTKRFHLVPNGFAADLLTLAAEFGSGPVVLSGCVVDALAAQPPLIPTVAAKAALAAPVIRQVRALQDARRGMTPGMSRVVFETTVIPFLEQSADPAAPLVAADPFAPEAWEAAVTLARFHRQDPQAGLALVPEALPYLDDISACRDRIYGDAP